MEAARLRDARSIPCKAWPWTQAGARVSAEVLAYAAPLLCELFWFV